jgi:sugar O-acyltransferase (sialic acid O-acetyltransferase NeuD family)
MDTVIIGAGGHGKVVLEILRAMGNCRPVGFVDADLSLAGKLVGGLPVLGPANILPKLRQQKVKAAIVAIGDNAGRWAYAIRLIEHGFELITAIHPNAVVSPTVTIGSNTVIAAGAVVCAETVLGDSVIVNTSAVVDHECIVGDGVHLCPMSALAGRVKVESGAFIGMGAKVIQCLSIGENAIVGAGAVVIGDVPAGSTVVGVPARVIKRAGMVVA